MNILIFGPNGSGKGTQGSVIQKKYSISHIESGVIFRENIKKGTDLGKQAKAFIDKGDLVPDNITIPMILDRLKQDDCKGGWLLDGFPRNLEQGEALNAALEKAGIGLDYVVEIILDRESAKKRIMGRKLCAADNNHPNNIYIDAIKPTEKDGAVVCRICGGSLSARSDDQDEEAINKRHNIYYDKEKGTLASVGFFKKLSVKNNGKPAIIELNGTPSVKIVGEELASKLK